MANDKAAAAAAIATTPMGTHSPRYAPRRTQTGPEPARMVSQGNHPRRATRHPLGPLVAA